MREIFMMIVVLTFLSSASGGLLAYLKDSTKDQIEKQELEFVKGPAVREILKDASNDPIADRFKIAEGDVEQSFFVGVFDGQANTVVFEAEGKGYGDKIGLMVGVNVSNDQLVGIGVTTHKETPGLGANAKDDPSFAAQFAGKSAKEAFKVTKDGGAINAISGATVTSRGVCAAVTEAVQHYQKLKPAIEDNLKKLSP
jgi:electron transport complex protein RnfG